MEKICVLETLHSGMLTVLMAMSSMLIKPPYRLNKDSLNRKTHKIGVCVDQLTNMLQLEAHRNFTLNFL